MILSRLKVAWRVMANIALQAMQRQRRVACRPAPLSAVVRQLGEQSRYEQGPELADGWHEGVHHRECRRLDAGFAHGYRGERDRSGAEVLLVCQRRAPGPAGERDRLWAFLLAIGFIHEALQIVRPNFPRIRDLARLGGVSEESITTAGQLLSGRLPLNRTIDRMRNKLIFHWDDDLVREYTNAFSKDEVTWAEGVGHTQGESVFTAAANALTNSVLPDEPNATEERNVERVRELVEQIPPTTAVIVEILQRAIMGHLKAHDIKLK